MTEKVVEPLPVEYSGMDATEHLVDAQRLGQSMQGVARLYRSVTHFYLTGRTPRRLLNAHVRVMAGPPRSGSVTYLVWVLLAHGSLPVYPQLLWEFADMCVPEFVKGMLSRRGGRKQAMAEAVDKIHELAKGNQEITNRILEFAQNVHAADQAVIRSQAADKERLYGIIEKLAQRNSGAMIDMVAPVGNSVATVTHAKAKPAEFVIDEPIAEAIRRGDLEVRDPVELVARLEAVDRINRTCKIVAPDFDRPVKGKITDPALVEAHNVYTRALDEKSEVIVTGKPVHKDGELHEFYISDAKPKVGGQET